MSEYPKKLVSDAGGVAMVNDAKGEASLKQRGYKEYKVEKVRPPMTTGGWLAKEEDQGATPPRKENPKRKTPVRTPQLSRGPKKRKR